jgi:hypothetical protein
MKAVRNPIFTVNGGSLWGADRRLDLMRFSGHPPDELALRKAAKQPRSQALVGACG